MRFDARTAKQLLPGAHLNIDGCPGLRLQATTSRRSWIYRYKSPVDGRMRQIKIGEWPALSIAAAAVEWERLRDERNAGNDPALKKRQAHGSVGVMVQQGDSPTVREICAAYLKGHIDVNRGVKGATEVARMFRTMIEDIADLPVAEVTRERAFAKIDAFRHIPVQASKLRLELGAAWDYALDAGKIPESTPNWWRQIMRGRLRSNGKRIQGQPVGTVKRFLNEGEVGALINWLPNFSRNVEDALILYLWTGTRGASARSSPSETAWDYPDGASEVYDHEKHEYRVDVPVGGRIVFRIGGTELELRADGVTLRTKQFLGDVPDSTFIGNTTTEKLLTFNGGMQGKGGGNGGPAVKVQGGAIYTDDVEIAGKSFIGHRHMEEGDGAPVSPPL
ncbi:integrase arm-type DNA-binding domain-containing protein [Burkholderia multivorans]|uniref:integrase arm-type DNA-binding domain-containing protein n=1 Tax=Burkholderia multivorans TaxID=87883 RepID=UPI001FC822D9|nr:integrase arm-type DNA-binding domain-containing protein [Burkholderia multivorans]